ncbi:MAG: cupin domain-containing protein [Terriglobia bacterium]
MNAKEWERKLREEGFSVTYAWEDGPNEFYPDHTHSTVTAHVILEGGMTLTSQGKTQSYQPSDRFHVPAGAVHSARMGPAGCRYLIGEK